MVSSLVRGKGFALILVQVKRAWKETVRQLKGIPSDPRPVWMGIWLLTSGCYNEGFETQIFRLTQLLGKKKKAPWFCNIGARSTSVPTVSVPSVQLAHSCQSSSQWHIKIIPLFKNTPWVHNTSVLIYKPGEVFKQPDSNWSLYEEPYGWNLKVRVKPIHCFLYMVGWYWSATSEDLESPKMTKFRACLWLSF